MQHTLRRNSGLTDWEKRHKHALLFAALGHEIRLLLLAKLANGELLSISELTEDSELTRQAVSKHLRVLEITGFVRGLRAGRQKIFQVNPRRVKELKKYLERVSAEWDEALAGLEAYVEK